MTDDVSPAVPPLTPASVDQGAGLICFILGPRNDCMRNREALFGPSVSSSSSIGLDK